MNISNTSFTGLWTVNESKKVKKDGYKVYTAEKTYYPFLDEDKETVKEIKRKNTKSHSIFDRNICEYIGTSKSHCKIGDTLPFTEAQYIDYIAGRFLFPEKIENVLKKYSLEKYIIEKKHSA